ncbi:MAG: 3-methyl-2-oxobutanoate hydroxymethyltransferase [Armatimonadota bacterium]
MDRKKTTVLSIKKKKQNNEKITVLTAYDYPTAVFLDNAGIDMVLVGDSLGNVVLGYENTLQVTMDDIIHHTKAVARGIKYAYIISDMPFLTYQVNPEQALINAGRLIQEGCSHSVKLEGGMEMVPAVKKIVDAGIPVMGHLGFTPQSVYKFGGYRVQGRSETDAERILNDAKALEEAGVFAIVLELVPSDLAKQITESINVPTIGIGAGPYCDGQVQISNDILGTYPDHQPKHAKKYLELSEMITDAFKAYAREVEDGEFPGPEHSF